MKEHLASTPLRFLILDSEVVADPPPQLQALSKPPRQFLTYKETCGAAKPSAVISAAALVMALEQTLRVAKGSPLWSAERRKGAIAMVIHLDEQFELGMERRVPPGLNPAE